jgi:hypothetical protein
MTAPTYQACYFCGRYPALVFSVRRHVGMLVVQTFVKLRQPLCRDHAREITKAFTLRTLWQGWWGYISFFVNWFVLAANASVFFRANRMAAPLMAAPLVAAPLIAAEPAAYYASASQPVAESR